MDRFSIAKEIKPATEPKEEEPVIREEPSGFLAELRNLWVSHRLSKKYRIKWKCKMPPTREIKPLEYCHAMYTGGVNCGAVVRSRDGENWECWQSEGYWLGDAAISYYAKFFKKEDYYKWKDWQDERKKKDINRNSDRIHQWYKRYREWEDRKKELDDER